MACTAFHSCKMCGQIWHDSHMIAAECPSCGERNPDFTRIHKAAMKVFWVDTFRDMTKGLRE